MIKLTLRNSSGLKDEYIYVNENMITFVSRDGNREYTSVSFPGTDDNYILVNETVEDVVKKINESKRSNYFTV